jgi:hypothetical protein
MSRRHLRTYGDTVANSNTRRDGDAGLLASTERVGG